MTIVLNAGVFPQQKNNLEQIYTLVDSSLSLIKPDLEDKGVTIYVDFKSPPNLEILENRVLRELKKSDFLLSSNEKSDIILKYYIEDVGISYPDSYRDGIFGDYKIVRTASLDGSYNLTAGGLIKSAEEFKLTETDTVSYDNIQQLENSSLSFITGELPPEPLFFSLLEPVVAVSAVAVAVYLLFSVRSK